MKGFFLPNVTVLRCLSPPRCKRATANFFPGIILCDGLHEASHRKGRGGGGVGVGVEIQVLPVASHIPGVVGKEHTLQQI